MHLENSLSLLERWLHIYAYRKYCINILPYIYIFGIIFKGKKPETILRKMQVAMEEARWRQPSIVVFDDVDYLIKQPDPVKDAEPTVQYHSKLAEGYSLHQCLSLYFYIREIIHLEQTD